MWSVGLPKLRDRLAQKGVPYHYVVPGFFFNPRAHIGTCVYKWSPVTRALSPAHDDTRTCGYLLQYVRHVRTHAHTHTHTHRTHTHTHRTHAHTHTHIQTCPGVLSMAVPTAEAPVIEPLNLFSTETVETLANGFLAVLEPDLQHVQKNIDDLMLDGHPWYLCLYCLFAPSPLPPPPPHTHSASQEDMLQSVNEKKAYFQDQKEAADIAATVCVLVYLHLWGWIARLVERQ